MKYAYAGGVLPEERQTIERFELDVMPFVEKNGGRIGECAMRGDLDATEVIRRYNQFCSGMPHLREWNLKILIGALKRWQSNTTNYTARRSMTHN